MRAMILAAGRGERMRELTVTTPKPLLKAHGRYLIEYSILHLQQAGIKEIVINVAYHADQIQAALGDGRRYGVALEYSVEPERLETGGGIFQALPLLGAKPFLVMSSDVVSNYPIEKLPKQMDALAHLVLVDNPAFHPKGDFGLQEGYVAMNAKPSFTFGNIGIYHPDLFAGCSPGHFPLNRLLFPAIERKQITGEYFKGQWFNIGTPEQLQEFVASAYILSA